VQPDHHSREEHSGQPGGRGRGEFRGHTEANSEAVPKVERRRKPRVRKSAPIPAGPPHLDAYEPIVGTSELDELRFLAQSFRGKSVQIVNSSEFLEGMEASVKHLVTLFQELDIRSRVEQIDGEELESIAGELRESLQGTQGMREEAFRTAVIAHSKRNRDRTTFDANFVVVHDPESSALIEAKRKKQCWVWRSYLDLSRAAGPLWEVVRHWIERYDGAILSSQRFAPKLSIPQYMFYPCIDPLSDRNKPLDPSYIQQVCDECGIDRSRAVVTQVAAFEAENDISGVIQAFRAAKESVDCQLVLAAAANGGAASGRILDEAREAAENDSDVIILPASSEMEINALQRASTVIIHKPTMERFGFAVAEAMWKGKPVIGSAVGVIPNQIIHNITGTLVHSIEDCANQIRSLLTEPQVAEELGKNAREHVKENFLITSNLKRWLLLFQTLSEVAGPS